MIKNPDLLEKLEKEFISHQKLSHQQALKIFESMWSEAVELGILPLKNPLDGIQIDIKLARVLNSCLKKSSPR